MTGHCLSHPLASPLRRLDAEQTDLLKSERACYCCKSRIKGMAGLVGGPALELLLAADWSSKLGNAAARSSLSSRPDLHWDFRTRDDREVMKTEQDSRVSLHNDVLEEKGRCIDGI